VRLCLSLAAWFALGASAWAQSATQMVPAPSQVEPPVITPPSGGGRIALPQVPAGAQIPAQAKKLSFKLLGFDVSGEFAELAPARHQIEAPLVGKRITVADVFEFADRLQQVYVRAGYPLARVVILPQEFETSARIKLRVIDGFVERMDLGALSPNVRDRVAAVLAPLAHRTHLKQSELERQLLIAGEAPGLVLNAVFAAGKEVGGSVLVLAGRYRPVSASVYTDNALPAVFGTGQVVTSVSLNSLLGAGEQMTLSAAGLPDKDFVTKFPTRRYLSGTFSIPLGIDGWNLEFGGTGPFPAHPGHRAVPPSDHPGRVAAGTGPNSALALALVGENVRRSGERGAMSRRKTERLLSLVVCLLSTRRFLTAEQIRQAVAGYPEQPEAFKRMFERDKEELRELGIPLETGPINPLDGEDTGYRVQRQVYELPELVLEPDEAAVLGLAARVWHNAELAGAAAGAGVSVALRVQGFFPNAAVTVLAAATATVAFLAVTFLTDGGDLRAVTTPLLRRFGRGRPPGTGEPQ